MIHPCRRDSDEGATAVETAVVVVIIFLLFLGMMDLSRVLAAKVVAMTSAQDGLELAQRIPGLGIDLQAACAATTYPYPGGTPGWSQKCAEFDAARGDVLLAAEKKALATLMSASSVRYRSQSSLVPFRFLSKATGETVQQDSALLMPGDYAKAQFSSGERTLTNPPGTPLRSGLPWNDVLKQYPMMVYVCFEMTPILRVGSLRYRSCGLATGYRPPVADVVKGPVPISTFAVPVPTTIPPTPTTIGTTSTTVGGACGNLVCGPGEDCVNCPVDCGSCCGNGSCTDPGEDCNTCPADCGACPPGTTTTVTSTVTSTTSLSCPDGSCGGGETCVTCPMDCGNCCGNGSCTDPGEDCFSCPFDCGPCCGNGSCSDPGEDCNSCPSDCGACPPTTTVPSCSDGSCNGSETCFTCPSDCGACCGNGSCSDPGENCNTCPSDCGPCPPTTTLASCPDGSCSGGETCVTCPADCGACCGNGSCTNPGENCSTCPSDCGPCCGNGTCTDPGENCATCPSDCGGCTTTSTSTTTSESTSTSTTSTSISTTTTDICFNPGQSCGFSGSGACIGSTCCIDGDWTTPWRCCVPGRYELRPAGVGVCMGQEQECFCT